MGLIDTGADECAIPASYAPILGHNLQAGQTKYIETGNGETAAYSHVTEFEIHHPETGEHLYTVKQTPVDFMPNLQVVLLGVNNFLSRFVLTIDYPKKIFSITKAA
jgi:predicted aspartyl protease